MSPKQVAALREGGWVRVSASGKIWEKTENQEPTRTQSNRQACHSAPPSRQRRSNVTLTLCAGSIIFRIQLMLPEAQHPQVQTVVEQEIGAVCRTLWPKFDLDRWLFHVHSVVDRAGC
jgi:hypothetical protein